MSETGSHNARLRACQPRDLDRLHEINCGSTPGVSEETKASLDDILAHSDCLVVGSDAGRSDGWFEADGFITLIEPGTLAYKSENLRWFERWQAATGHSLIYVDRIAIHADKRGNALGHVLYKRTFEAYSDREFIGAEVNTLPDNPGSHRFHQRLGFHRVGEQTFSENKAVAYYVRELAQAPQRSAGQS